MNFRSPVGPSGPQWASQRYCRVEFQLPVGPTSLLSSSVHRWASRRNCEVSVIIGPHWDLERHFQVLYRSPVDHTTLLSSFGHRWDPRGPTGLTMLLSSRIAATSGPYGSERVNFQPPITIILLLVRNLRVGRRFNWRFLNFV